MADASELAAQLREIEQIKQLKVRYFRLLDSKQWVAWSETFTEDAELLFDARVGDDTPKWLVGGRRYIKADDTARHGRGDRTPWLHAGD